MIVELRGVRASSLIERAPGAQHTSRARLRGPRAARAKVILMAEVRLARVGCEGLRGARRGGGEAAKYALVPNALETRFK